MGIGLANCVSRANSVANLATDARYHVSRAESRGRPYVRPLSLLYRRLDRKPGCASECFEKNLIPICIIVASWLRYHAADQSSKWRNDKAIDKLFFLVLPSFVFALSVCVSEVRRIWKDTKEAMINASPSVSQTADNENRVSLRFLRFLQTVNHWGPQSYAHTWPVSLRISRK